MLIFSGESQFALPQIQAHSWLPARCFREFNGHNRVCNVIVDQETIISF